MLHRLFGRQSEEKKEAILKVIRTACDSGTRVFILVPEQATARYERLVALHGGASSWEFAEVTNFSRLPNIVLRSYGSLARRSVTREEKKLLLYRTLIKHKKALSALEMKTDADSLEEIYQELEEFRLAGLSPEAILSLSEKGVVGNALLEKLGQLSLLLSAYREEVSSRFDDPEEEEVRLAGILEHYPFFRESIVIIDGFWDFTFPQERLIRSFLSQAKEVYVSFTAEKKNEALFAKPLRAARRILRFAGEVGVKTEEMHFETSRSDSALSFLQKNLTRGSVPYEKKPDEIRLVSCRDRGAQARFVAREILSLVQGGARWNEIAVLSRTGENDEILSLVLKSEHIPHFYEERKSLLKSPLAQTVLLSAKIALGDTREETVRAYLKEGIFAAEEQGRFLLEKYAATWSVSGSVWLREDAFVKNPDGYFPLNERQKAELSEICRAKEEIFLPVRRLSLALAAGTVAEKVASLVAHLNAIGTQTVLFSRIRERQAEGDWEEAARLTANWNALLEALSAMARSVGDEACEGKDLITLLTLALSAPLPGSLPPAQDRVEIGLCGFARPEEAKYIFLTDLNAGVFPAAEKSSVLLSPREREELSELGFSLSCPEKNTEEETFFFYLACSYAKEKLFLTHTAQNRTATDQGSLSVFGKRVLSLFPHLSHESFSLGDAPPETREEAFSYWAEHLEKRTLLTEQLERYFSASDEFSQKMLDLAAGMAFSREPFFLQEEKPYQNKNVNMTYSRMDLYTNCAFSFFSRYLLEAKKSGKASFGANIVGSFVHKVLEEVLTKLEESGKALTDLSPEALAEENLIACKKAFSDLLPEGAPARVAVLCRRIERSTLLILQNLQQEFSVSRFRPIFFEKSLSELSRGYRVPLPDGSELCLYGEIDRVDLYKAENGEDYVRVVDYKTGGHAFSLTDVANGLDLQMLLYLFALWKGGFEKNGKKISPLPAGVLYLNGMEKNISCETAEEVKKVEEDPFFSLSREGLLVDDPALLEAADPEGEGAFLPIAWKKKSSGKKDLISMEKLGRLQKKVEKDFAHLAMALKDGHIEARPLYHPGGKVDPCRFCDYLSLCKRNAADRRPYQTKISEEDLFGKEEEHG